MYLLNGVLKTLFPNSSVWFNATFSGLSQYHIHITSSRADLKRGINKAKHSHKLRMEEHFKNNSDPRRMWQGIQAITDFKPTNTTTPNQRRLLP